MWDSRNRRRHDPVECTYVISGDAEVDDVDVQGRKGTISSPPLPLSTWSFV